MSGISGNVSCKFYDDGVLKIAVTQSGVSLKNVKKEDVVLVDMHGKVLEESDKKPSSEVFMHLGIYKTRVDVGGIVHTHSPVAVGFSIVGKTPKTMEGLWGVEDEHIPLVEYAPPGSMKLANYVSQKMKNKNAVLLEKHGVVAVGKNPDEAALLAEAIEELAKMQFVSEILSLESLLIHSKRSI